MANREKAESVSRRKLDRTKLGFTIFTVRCQGGKHGGQHKCQVAGALAILGLKAKKYVWLDGVLMIMMMQ